MSIRIKPVLAKMYHTIQLPWSVSASAAEAAYRNAGLVKTKGTIYLLPPSRNTLIDTFNAPPRPKTRMSSGAVALCKHFERGGSSSEHGRAHPFWPLPVGSNENKTLIAASVLTNMLDNIAWKNVMMLHAGVAVYEIRNTSGFGMRWTLNLEDDLLTPAITSEELLEMKQEEPPKNEADRPWKISKVTFRGFLEPIEDLDHELPGNEKPK